MKVQRVETFGFSKKNRDLLRNRFNNHENIFLKQLDFWSRHRNNYGIEKEGRVWIYNTLEDWSKQLSISKRSIQRVVKSLKDLGIINSQSLSSNKRNRTLFYSVNYEKLQEFLSSNKSTKIHVNKVKSSSHMANSDINSDHMVGHMHIDNNKQNNKSYKSKKNKIRKNSEQIIHEKQSVDLKNDKIKILSVETSDLREESSEITSKPTIIQDMLKIWKEEFSTSKIELTKNLARFLVAAFKTKFKSCLKEWRKYLKTLKTSAYLMSEKFKLSIWWIIKFITIDRIRAGELGVNSDKITLDKKDLEEKMNRHILFLDETESCKELRYRIIEKLSIPTYLSWFTCVKFSENNGKIIMKATSEFVEDWIKNNFAEQCGLYLE